MTADIVKLLQVTRDKQVSQILAVRKRELPGLMLYVNRQRKFITELMNVDMARSGWP